MVPGDAAARDQNPVHPPGEEAAQRDVVRLPARQPSQRGAAAARVVDVHRVGTAGDRVLEGAGREHVVARELVLAHDPARLPHADLDAALRDVGVREARHPLAQEAGDLRHLPVSRELRPGQVPHAGAEHFGDTGRVHRHLTGVGGGEEEHVLAGQVQLPGVRGGADQVPQPVHAPPLVRVGAGVGREVVLVEADHAEHQRHGLRPAVLRPADLVRGPRRRGDVPVPGAVDDDVGVHDEGPGLRLEHRTRPVRQAEHVGGEGVQERTDLVHLQ